MIAPRYRIEEALGTGTSGTVYRAFDEQLGRAVALKVLHPAIAAREDARRRFLREARVAAQFHHPGAAQVFEVGEGEQGPFLVMELLPGMSLERAIETAGAPCSLPSLLRIGSAIAEVLAAAHAAGVVHRDVKPANAFLSGTLADPGQVRLVDFGLAFMVAPRSESLGRITVEGDLLGTPAYMAPEQCEAQEVGPAADVYALGCLLYELVTGKPPFVGNLARIIAGHVYLPAIPIAERDLARPVPAELGDLIGRMLEKAPERRPTAAEVAALLPTFAGPLPGRGATGSRADRAVPLGDSGATLVRAAGPHRIAIAQADDELAAALQTRGFDLVAAEVADVVLVPLTAAGAPAIGAPADAVLVGLHPAPDPSVLTAAIRAGVTTVVRWPGAADALSARLRSVRSTRR